MVWREALTVLLASLFLLSAISSPVSVFGDSYVMVQVYIRADGSVETYPAGVPANISSIGDYYLLTGDIYGSLIVEKSGVWIDGGGHALRGPGGTAPGPIGLKLVNVSMVYVSNLVITGFSTGVYLYLASQNHFYNITVKDNYMHGAEITFSDGNFFTYCYFVNNANAGVYIKSSKDNVFSKNAFIDNGVHATVWGIIYPNKWDDGYEGNYWSGHTCVDQDRDGICENEYVIAVDNVDRRPLAKPPLLTQETTGTTTTTETTSTSLTATTTQSWSNTTQPPQWTTADTYTTTLTSPITHETTTLTPPANTWVFTTTVSTDTHPNGKETTSLTQTTQNYVTSPHEETTPRLGESSSQESPPQSGSVPESGEMEPVLLVILVSLLLFSSAASLIALKIRGKRGG